MRNYRLKRLIINGQKSDNWYVTWTDRGRSKRLSTNTAVKAEAERELERIRAEHNKPPEKFDMNAIFDGYEKDRIAAGRKSANLRTSLKPLRQIFGSSTPALITQAEIRRYKRERKGSPSSCTRELLTLRAALKWAYGEGWTEHYRPFKVEANRNPRKRFLSQSEYDRLYATADTVRLKTFLSLGIFTAARSQKIYSLKWEDVDFTNRVINFSAGQSSNKRSRAVPMNETLAWHLMGARLMAMGDYVIEYNGKPVRSIRGPFRRAVSAAGLRDITIHDLRRTAASWMLQRGATLDMVAKILDDSVEVVERHYGHLAPRHMKDATDLLG